MHKEIVLLAPQIWQEIEKAQNVLLHFHVYPDGDSIGSALGLCHALQSVGKQVSVIRGDSPIPASFRAVPGIEQVLPQSLGETNLADFDLFIILDSATPNRITAEAEMKFPPHLRTVVIDHHPDNPRYGEINLVVPEYPATAQILCELLELWQVEISEATATCLFLGMFTDTGGFRYPATMASTLQAAARLRERAPGIAQVLFELENNYSPEELRFDALAYGKTEVIGGLAVVAVSYADLVAQGLVGVRIETGHISNKLKSVNGWEIGICLVEDKPGHVKLSSRTRNVEKYNLSELVKLLGGGGHRAAAGAIMTGVTVVEARERLLEAVRKLHPDLLES